MTTRHQLIYLHEKADFSIQTCFKQNDFIHEAVRSWIACGFPCIYARQNADRKDSVNLGLTLLFENRKQRIGIEVKKTAILKQTALPQLLEMQAFFLRYYGVADISFLSKQYPRVTISVYGSFLLHYLTGLPFVDEYSDLDLLIDYPQCSLRELEELVYKLNEKFGRVIDGEIRFKDLGDVGIKELINGSTVKVLCKSHDEVALIERAALYEQYPRLY